MAIKFPCYKYSYFGGECVIQVSTQITQISSNEFEVVTSLGNGRLIISENANYTVETDHRGNLIISISWGSALKPGDEIFTLSIKDNQCLPIDIGGLI